MKNLIDCPAERAVYFLGGKWKIRILFSLLQSKKIRFGELKKRLKKKSKVKTFRIRLILYSPQMY